MSTAHSPLRYPGGKQVLGRLLCHLLHLNGLGGGTYAEPYAGGCGAALWLLFGEYVNRILINDADFRLYCLWESILRRSEQLAELIERTVPNTAEWERQREIYFAPSHFSRLRVGFATFFLNRCNRSGIIARGGMIGGRSQSGVWRIDARYNGKELANRVRKIAIFRDRITLTRLDALDFIKGIEADTAGASRTFVYLDPPYYRKGSQLYLNFYDPEDHALVAAAMRKRRAFRWVMTYDNVPEIRRLYREFNVVTFNVDYSTRNGSLGREVMIYPDGLRFPGTWTARIPRQYITAADGVTIPTEGQALRRRR